jgi:UDP-N-acetylmuramyl tripeptide synthase
MDRWHLDAAPAQARLTVAISGARLAALACKASGRGGTSLPGLVALRLDPRLVERLSGQLGGGAVVVAGTNGKTTTASLLASALRAGGRRVLHNRAGSNMLRGIATTLAAQARLDGELRDGGRLTGLFEVDEAALPGVLERVRPRVIVLTNLFRDQLDRYGELQTTADRWRAALRRLPASTRLVVNADDPLVASLGQAAPGQVFYFGIERWPDEERDTRIAASADSLYCPRCAALLRFASVSYAHLGHWSCPSCGMARPPLDLAAAVDEAGAHGSRFHIDRRAASGAIAANSQTWAGDLRLSLPGHYNVYNALAALAGAAVAGVDLEAAVAALAEEKGAFGRAERIAAAGRMVQLFLIKNPTGADEVLRVIAAGDRAATLLLLLNDLAADGHDVSWIWDTRFDLLQSWSGSLHCGGTRAEDMALRCKYAGLPVPISVIGDDVPRAVRAALDAVPHGEALVIVATYTAMLAARDTLARAGHVAQFWQVPA